MNLRDGLRALRAELGLTQTGLATGLGVSYAAVSRWERGQSRPNRAAALAVMSLAKQRGVSGACMDCLHKALFASHEDARAYEPAPGGDARHLPVERRELLTSQQLKQIIDSMDIGVFGVRVYSASPGEPTLFYFNQHLSDMLGYPLVEFLDSFRKSPYSSIHKDDLPTYRQRLFAVMSGSAPLSSFDIDVRLHRRDGTQFWVNLKAISMNAFSDGMELFATCRDIHARTLSGGMLHVIARQFFDFIGCVDVKTGAYERYYAREDVAVETLGGTYQEACAAWVEHCVPILGGPVALSSLSLPYVLARLEQARFFSFFFLTAKDGELPRRKKIMFTYLDDTRRVLLVAQSDAEDIDRLRLLLPNDNGKTRRSG